MNFTKYILKKEFPEKPVKPLLKHGAISEDYRTYADQLLAWENDTINYNKICADLREEQAQLEQQFKIDLFIELGIKNNPKRDLLYTKAWEEGHSSGLYEVYGVACQWVELIL
jgi:hypothetical protein